MTIVTHGPLVGKDSAWGHVVRPEQGEEEEK